MTSEIWCAKFLNGNAILQRMRVRLLACAELMRLPLPLVVGVFDSFS